MAASEIRPLPLQFRALYAHWKVHKPSHRQKINWCLFDDVETTSSDMLLRALFGWAQLRTVRENDDGTITTYTVREVLYYADDLPAFRPETFKRLKLYSEQHTANVDLHYPSYDDYEHGQLDVSPDEQIVFISHTEFVREYIGGVCYSDVSDPEYSPAMLVGYNYSFDIFRHAIKSITRPTGFFRGGLGADLIGCGADGDGWDLYYRETKAGIGYIRELRRKSSGSSTRDVPVSNIVDLAQLVRAMTSKPHSLLSAGKAFGASVLKYEGTEIHDPEQNSGLTGNDLRELIDHYIGYARNDVAATASLWEKVTEKFRRHPIDLPENQAFSAASLVKQYLRQTGIHASRCQCSVVKECDSECCDYLCTCGDCKLCGSEFQGCKDKQRGGLQIPPEILGRAMGAFYGGRAFCNVRLTHLQSVLVDFTSQYPTQMILTGIWDLLVAESVDCREETDEVIRLIDSLTLKDLYKPGVHRQLCGLADVIGDGGDWLPVRAPYNTGKNQSPGIGNQYVDTAGRPVPWTLADIAASKIRTGRTPNIVRAWRFYPSGEKQSTLKPVNFNGNPDLRFDPAAHGSNLLKFLVEQRFAAKIRHVSVGSGKADPARPRRRLQEDAIAFGARVLLENKMAKHPELVTARNIETVESLEYPADKCDCAACVRLWRLLRAHRIYGGKPGYDHTIAQQEFDKADRDIADAHANDNNLVAWNADPKKCLAECCDTEYSIKILVNSIYGIFAQMDTGGISTGPGTVYGINGETYEVTNPEQPGEFCMPVYAAIITGGARLFLAMLEQEVINRGSAVIFGDTDSACIPASKSGTTQDGIRTLSYKTVDDLRNRFNRLNPYDKTQVKHLLNWEEPARDGEPFPVRPVYVTAISAKRYALSHRVNGAIVMLDHDDDMPDDPIEDYDGVAVVKGSRHGLGLYVNPMTINASDDKDVKSKSWFDEAWAYITSRHSLNDPDATEPGWLDRPAVSKFPVRSRMVYDVLDKWCNFQACDRCDGDGGSDGTTGKCARCDGTGRVHKPVHESIIPGSFFLSFYPAGFDGPEKARLIAPFESDPAKWTSLPVRDIKSGRVFRVTTVPEEVEAARDTGESVILVKSYRQVLWEYVHHPETKSDGQDGTPCKPDTRGRMQPCHVLAMGHKYITKDSSSLHTADDAYLHDGPRVYGDDTGSRTLWVARKVIAEAGYSRLALAKATGTSDREARTFTSDSASRNRFDAEAAYLRFAVGLAVTEMTAAGVWGNRKGIAPDRVLALYHSFKRSQEMEAIQRIMSDMAAMVALSGDDLSGMLADRSRIREQVGQVITIHEVREFKSAWGNPFAAVVRYQTSSRWVVSTCSGNFARQVLRLDELGELPVDRLVCATRMDVDASEWDSFYLKKVGE